MKWFRRVRPQFQESVSWYLLHDDAPAHSSGVSTSFWRNERSPFIPSSRPAPLPLRSPAIPSSQPGPLPLRSPVIPSSQPLPLRFPVIPSSRPAPLPLRSPVIPSSRPAPLPLPSFISQIQSETEEIRFEAASLTQPIATRELKAIREEANSRALDSSFGRSQRCAETGGHCIE
jgi:hypothetical protein